ncbi:Holliday junction resolvase [Polaribacter phage Freya_1]|uniref:Uncharacterized protein n=1 Tax=Polaribacter phage Freya_1 TaxID=2745662 RepID=A0A8E4ZM86_9CAUD|nr:Holliday junction resolvase [Polaribacter phage Freya_1]QQV90941.1 hypothetical protein Freya2_4 [Polaribacter phage Freya_2]QQV91009.1 hypothetical protein Freya3_4 [Polaribacter phage Freya_3]QQV91077.1 hypothetical protein Freya4_4 [Polaribacter phage Freya_4]QQV91152.1 hypothetical protein Freya8_11 [Polaribacter phage Freya_8]QQV91229.1 hypothetical protein Freya9_13 [Polaribacter phage Freya_9]QQV91307.1 hypothetical protein Freya10_14 [Polaribacter phage Freya_10]QYV99886.1 hypothe
MILIGIDPGVKTGFAVICNSEKKAITLTIHNALQQVKTLLNQHGEIHVRVEDARKRKWFGPNSAAKKQGAGSIKRDCKIWYDFLKELSKEKHTNLTFEMIHPIKGGTKIDKELFKKMSGIKTVTSEHARDAFLLIMNYKK